MKMIFRQTFFIAVLFPSVLFAHAGAAYAAANQSASQSPAQKLQFPKSEFVRTEGDETYCQGDLVRVRFEGDAENRVLVLGEKIIFANIGQAKHLGDTFQGCQSATTTALSFHKIEQSTTNNCQDKSKNTKDIHQLSFDKNQLVYVKKRLNAEEKSVFTQKCVYELDRGNNE